MSHTLSLSDVHAVRRALAAGMRHTEIARELNLSVWTISRLANERRYEREELADSELPEEDAPPEYFAQNLRRCPTCGAMVYLWPCLACRLATTARLELTDEVIEDDEEENWADIFTDEMTRT